MADGYAEAFHHATNLPPSWAGHGRSGATWTGPPTATLPLPTATPLEMAVSAALRARGSCRRFTGEPLSVGLLGTLLAGTYGCGDEVEVSGLALRTRPVPSAGARYPLVVDVIALAVDGLATGIHRYVPEDHALRPRGAEVEPTSLPPLFLGQPYLASAAVIVVLSATFAPTLDRYGDRGYRYVLFEAGHAAQNLALLAAAAGSGCLHLGGFWDNQLALLLGLAADEQPLYATAVGRPATHDPQRMRQPGAPPDGDADRQAGAGPG